MDIRTRRWLYCRAGTMAESEKDSLDQEPVEHEYDTFLREVARARASGLPGTLADLREPGDTLLSGRFSIQRELGRGGMGVVYSALDKERDRTVALKILSRAEPSGIYRLKNEFRSLSGVVHRNLVGLDELFVDQGVWFFTMELVRGEDFLSWVRPEDRLDEARLRNSATELAQGIRAIHEAGKLHRDLKPSNVLVEPQGRVVILDFGLASDQHQGGIGQTLHEDSVSGTPCYMAPEQAAAQPAVASSDWYAFGVMLFEPLTGRPPFEGGQQTVLMRKQQQDAPRPSSINPDIPSDLEQLCIGLLQRDPEARPGWQEIIRVLGPMSEPVDSLPPRAEVPFVGRIEELRALQEAFEATEQGQPVMVYVHGVSGVGKTTLVEHFLDGLQGRDKAVVLSGRCYESESVPFKACDSLVDALSRYLKKLPPEQATHLLPTKVRAIAQLFPALQRLDFVTRIKQRHRLPRDATELRHAAFTAFKELLAGIAAQESLVLFVDDLQWSDVDGAKLLSSVLSRPDPPALLLIGAYPSEGDTSGVGLSTLRERIQQFDASEVREIALGELSEPDAEGLARQLLSAEIKDRASQIATEAQGSPFFITELAHFASFAQDLTEPVGLAEAIQRRLSMLGESERQVLQAICVSARPLQTSLLRAVTGTNDLAKALRRLQAEHLVRKVALGPSSEVSTYHDRIRASVVAAMDDAVVKSWHAKLAAAIEACEHPDLIALTDHLLGAGQELKAGACASRAADHAARSLAFDNAVRLYRMALELNPGNRENQRKLQTKLGKALASAGRGAEAAPAFIEAVEDASPEEQQELRRLAAYSWLMTGHITEGMQELDTVLRNVGLKLRSSRTSSIVDLLANRALIKLHGLNFRERQVEEVPSSELAELHACWAATTGLVLADAIQSVAFGSRFFRLALRSGIIEQIVLGLCTAAMARSPQGAQTRFTVNKYLNLAQKLSRSVEDHEVLAFMQYATGFVAFMMGEMSTAKEYLKRAEQMFVEECTGFSPFLNMTRSFLGHSYAYLGCWRELIEQWDVWMKDAQERNDVNMLSFQSAGAAGAFRYLAVDRADKAREQIAKGLELWPGQHFDMITVSAESMKSQIEWYDGNCQKAFEIAKDIFERVSKSPFYGFQSVRVVNRQLLARAALSFASVTEDRHPLLKVARQQAKQLSREQLPLAEPYVPCIKGGIAYLQGDRDSAAKWLREAVVASQKCQFKVHVAATNRQLGRLLGGDEGRALIAQADETMKQEGVVRPDRIAALLVPGFPD